MGTPIQEMLANLSNVIEPEPGFGLGGGASAIADLTDVNLISAQDGDVLVLSSDVWVNQSLGSAITAGISTWVGAAPSDLNTLQEIADRFADDEDVVTSLISTVGGKLTKSSNLSDLTNVGTARTNLGLGTAATHAATDFKTVAAYDVRQPGTSAQDTTFAIGVNALNALTSGARNIAIGKDAADVLTTASDVIAIGDNALGAATTVGTTVAIGSSALAGATSAQHAVAVGYQAMGASTVTGADNTGVGYQSLKSVASGTLNTALGSQAANAISSGARNTAVGSYAMQSNASGDNNVAIGYNTLGATNAAENIAIGSNAGGNSVSGTGTIWIGFHAGDTDGTTSTVGSVSNAVAIGRRAQAVADNVFVIGAKTSGDRLSLCLGNYGDQLGGGVGVFALSDADTVPTTNPTGGGILYSQAGALKWRDSSGTVRTLSSNYEIVGVAAALVDDLSGVTDAATARTNLGLGSAATHATTDYEAAGTAVLKSLVDAKGDIFVGSANDAVARLAVGTDGQVLTADSASTNGVKWAAAGGGGVANQAALARTGTTYLVASGAPDGLGGVTSSGQLSQNTTTGTLTNIPYADRALGAGTCFDSTATINSYSGLRHGQAIHSNYKQIYTIAFSLVSLADMRFFAGLCQTAPGATLLDQDDPSTAGAANQYVLLEISPTLNSGNITLVYGNNGGAGAYGSVDTGIAPSALTKYIFVVDFSGGTNMVCSIYNAAGTQLYTTTITDTTKIPLYNTNGSLLRGIAGIKNLVAASKKWYYHGESLVAAG